MVHFGLLFVLAKPVIIMLNTTNIQISHISSFNSRNTLNMIAFRLAVDHCGCTDIPFVCLKSDKKNFSFLQENEQKTPKKEAKKRETSE